MPSFLTNRKQRRRMRHAIEAWRNSDDRMLRIVTPLQGEEDGVKRFDLEAAGTGEADPNQRQRFRMLAYNGGLLHLPRYEYPVIVDLKGLKLKGDRVPILKNHDPDLIAGHTFDIQNDGRRLILRGTFSRVTDAGIEAEGLAKEDFPWNSSIGADPNFDLLEVIPPGRTVTVNGRTFEGPVLVSRETTLGESSFVPYGADEEPTPVLLAAKAGQLDKGVSQMKFSAWLKELGLKASGLVGDRLKSLKLAWRNEHPDGEDDSATIRASGLDADDDDDPDDEGGLGIQAAGGGGTRRRAGDDGAALDHSIEASRLAREAMTTERERQAMIDQHLSRFPELAVQASREGWDETRCRLEALTHERPQGPNLIIRGGDATPAVQASRMEAAICLQRFSEDRCQRWFDEQTLDYADREMRDIGLQEMFLTAAGQNGLALRPGQGVTQSNLRDVLQYAMPIQAAASSFSTLSLPGLLSNIANKEILEGFETVEDTWREVCAIKSVSDFKTVTSYRLLDDMEYEKLGPGGEIRHGRVGEQSYTRSAETYAKMFTLERTTIINDDLGALDDLRERVGMGSSEKMQSIAWQLFLNLTFWNAANKNLIQGVGSALDEAGSALEAAILQLAQQTAPGVEEGVEGKRIKGRAEVLLIPPELQFIAEKIYKNTQLEGGGSRKTTGNIHVNKYRPIVIAELSDAAYTNASATGWYLLRSKRRGAPLVASFLNGRQRPTVESSDADFNVLGVQFRGFHDFGFDPYEPLSGVKNTGVAAPE